jgi:tetratricopeptide (TPR) repeat protein
MTSSYLVDLALVHQRHQSHRRATLLLETALDRTDDKVERSRIYMRLGEALQTAGDVPASIVAYEAALSGLTDADERTRVQLRLGQQHRRAQQYDLAEQALLSAFQSATTPHTHDAARAELLQVWKAQNKLDGKIVEFEAQHAAEPDDIDAIKLLSVAYGQGGQAAKAVPLLEQLVRLEPDQIAHLQHLGNYAYQAGEHAKGIGAFEKLAEVAPQSRAQAYERIASGYAALDQRDKALQYAKRIGPLINSRTPYLYIQQGDLFSRLEEPELAESAYDKAIELASDPARKEDFRLKLAALFVARKDYAKAEGLLAQLVAGPGSARLREDAKRMLDSVKVQAARSAEPSPPASAEPASAEPEAG